MLLNDERAQVGQVFRQSQTRRAAALLAQAGERERDGGGVRKDSRLSNQLAERAVTTATG